MPIAVVEDNTPFQKVYNPGHPDADANGYPISLTDLDVHALAITHAYCLADRNCHGDCYTNVYTDADRNAPSDLYPYVDSYFNADPHIYANCDAHPHADCHFDPRCRLTD